ncbi:hypothetical protein [Leptospira noguchii]|uniref:hypothetical protein n=1 Tax=Leptospira noguchii TaxID=28182 RepID=UPI0005623462|nr:hypothetical protein [Leptospira noguchii]
MKVYKITEGNDCRFVFAKTELRAKRLYWISVVREGYKNFDKSYNISKLSSEEILEILNAIGNVPEGSVIDIYNYLDHLNYYKFKPILRKMGRRHEDEEKCEICRLYPFGMEKYLLNDEGICRECENSR